MTPARDTAGDDLVVLPRVRLREDDVVSGIYLACALLGVLAGLVWWWL